jgi:aerotaxis receptor
MRRNLPVTQREYKVPTDAMLVSTTDLQGRITHCNQAFVEASGFSHAALMGKSHNIVRHPDMPQEVFADLWATIARGRPWSGVVKNRRENGDHYWVYANITPVLEGGKPIGYMSVRLGASTKQVKATEALYARLEKERESGRRTIVLHAGGIRGVGWRDGFRRLHRLTMTQRLAIAMGLTTFAAMWPQVVPPPGVPVALAQAASLLVAGVAVVAWFHRNIARQIAQADEFAGHIAGCNLRYTVGYEPTNPIGSLLRRLGLINLNLRAIVSEVRSEVGKMRGGTAVIARGNEDMDARAEAQAENLKRTVASMGEITQTVDSTAEMAGRVAAIGDEADTISRRGETAIRAAVGSMSAIETSSRRIATVVRTLEAIAFQTNLLALNAAVEAARAGEHGKGFAIVASEVRALSQRSTGASREIRAQIQAASAEVAKGMDSVRAASATITELAGTIGSVTSLTQQISGAATAQAQGIHALGEVITSVDNDAQHRAMVVRQAADSAATLDDRANLLTRSVQVFLT